MGDLTPDDIEVQIYYGKVDGEIENEIRDYVIMKNVSDDSNPKKNIYIYSGELVCKNSGKFGYTVRALPKHSLLINPFEMGLIRWA